VAPLAKVAPLILTVHDLHVFSHPQTCTVANCLHYRLLMPPSIRRADAIIVYSEHVRRQVASRYPEVAARIEVIPPGVDRAMRPATAAERAALRAAVALPPAFLLFVGDLAPRKNLAGLLRAFGGIAQEMPGLHLLLTGNPGRGGETIERDAAALGLTGRVHFTGYLPQQYLAALYSLAEALVYPSLDEGFGLPVLEAMACGCPVVTADCGGPAEICGEAARYCTATEPESIAAAVRAHFADADARRQRVAVGLQRAAGYTWTRAAAQSEALYEKLLHS
jgi:glycosyltransferase involved in cell wall biosynthesis